MSTKLLFGLAFICLAACTPTTSALMSGHPMMALDLSVGAGSTFKDENGKTRFRYVFPPKHLDGLVEKPSQETARKDYIAAFISKRGICPNGWRVDSTTVVQGNLIYEGSCNR